MRWANQTRETRVATAANKLGFTGPLAPGLAGASVRISAVRGDTVIGEQGLNLDRQNMSIEKHRTIERSYGLSAGLVTVGRASPIWLLSA